MNRHVCWRDGRSRVYSVEVGQEQNINIGYPAALSAAGELRPVGVDAADIVPGIVAQFYPAVTPDGQSLAEVRGELAGTQAELAGVREELASSRGEVEAMRARNAVGK